MLVAGIYNSQPAYPAATLISIQAFSARLHSLQKLVCRCPGIVHDLCMHIEYAESMQQRRKQLIQTEEDKFVKIQQKRWAGTCRRSHSSAQTRILSISSSAVSPLCMTPAPSVKLVKEPSDCHEAGNRYTDLGCRKVLR